MSKYKSLGEHLSGREGQQWAPTFAEMEEVLGFSLPKAARGGDAWWGNDAEKPHNRAWLEAGWRVLAVDRKGETVTFARGEEKTAAEAFGVAEPAVEGAPAADALEAKPPLAERASEAARSPAGLAMIGGAAAALVGVVALAARSFLRRRG